MALVRRGHEELVPVTFLGDVRDALAVRRDRPRLLGGAVGEQTGRAEGGPRRPLLVYRDRPELGRGRAARVSEDPRVIVDDDAALAARTSIGRREEHQVVFFVVVPAQVEDSVAARREVRLAAVDHFLLVELVRLRPVGGE